MTSLPTFIVAGAQKSGTTWLFECLDEHPEIFVPRSKEVHYFCPPDKCRFSTCNKGLDWYRNQFSSPQSQKAKGDLTTDYMYYPDVATRLYQLDPNMKIVFLLRNPVERAYSAYWMWRRHKSDLPPFASLIFGTHSLIERGRYAEQIKPYIEYFGIEQIKVYIYEEIMKEPENFFYDIYQFLGVSPVFEPKSIRKRIAATKDYPHGLGKTIYKIGSKIINSNLLQPMWRYLRRHTNIHETVMELLGFRLNANAYPEMTQESRLQLENFYRQGNEELRILLNREKPIWSCNCPTVLESTIK